MSDSIELTEKEVSLVYYFAVRQIAGIAVQAKAESALAKKALAVFNGKDINDRAVLEFIKYYNKQKP